MKTMRCFGMLALAGLVAMSCADYAGKSGYQAPILSKDANALVELRGNIDFGAQVSDSFSVEKRLTGYVFDANQGARATVTLTSTNGEDPVLILYGPVDEKGIWGKPIALDDDGQDGRNSLISDLALPGSGRYLIGATTHHGSAGGTFDLTLGCRGACTEPNCPDVMCQLYCSGGLMTDPQGCPVCRCVDPECQVDSDCPPYQWSNSVPRCIEGRCVYDHMECTEDAQCPEGFVCAVQCWSDDCDPATGACPGGCDARDPNCVPSCVGYCQPQQDPPCVDGDFCSLGDGTAGICIAGRCVPQALECGDNQPCPPGYVCEIVCWDCGPASGGTDPNCLPGCVGRCVPQPPPTCNLPDIDCPEGFVCVMECWTVACDPSMVDCQKYCDPNTGVCNPVCAGHCVPRQEPQCYTDQDCWKFGAALGRCIDGICVYDNVTCGTEGTACPPGMECVTRCLDCVPEDPNCRPGCESYCVPVQTECWVDTDCISADGMLGRCVDGRCVFDEISCRTDVDCPPGFVCELRACANSCPAGMLECCFGVCVPSPQPECYTDRDCFLDPAGVVGRCIDGRCVYNDCTCQEIWEPVCAVGVDGIAVTYPNVCLAECQGARIIYPGTCEQDPTACLDNSQCPPGFYCEFCAGGGCAPTGICMPLPELQCQFDGDCPPGFRCELQPCMGMPCDPVTGICPPCWGKCVPVVPDENACIQTGCNGEICAPYPVGSSCIWLPEYDCLYQFASCQLLYTSDGQRTCGWMYADGYWQCLDSIYNAGQCQDDTGCPPGTICERYCDASGICKSLCLAPTCVCPEYYEPVCGVDGISYDNHCFLNCAGVSIAYPGSCDQTRP